MAWTIAVALALLAGVAPAAPVHADPIVSAPLVTVNVGGTFSIPISIASAVDLVHWQLDLGFDRTIVRANLVTEGDFLSAFGATSFGPGVIDNASGLISLVTGSYVDLDPLPSGDGTLALVEFTALSGGVSPLAFSSVFLNLVDAGFTLADGQITVLGPTAPVPGPAAVVLAAGGFALLATARLVRGGRNASE